MKINISRNQLKNYIIFLHIVFAIIGIYIFFYNYSLSESLLVQKTFSQQAILSRSGANSIKDFFQNVENQLFSFGVSLEKTDESSPIDRTGVRLAFQAFFQKSTSPINEIALYDETGKLLVIENRERITTGEGQDFSDRDFIIWSKNSLNSNKVFIASSYTAKAGSSVGKNIIVFASPFYFGTKYKGTMTIRVLLDKFQAAFINPLNPGIDENAFIVDTDGYLRAGQENLINKNLISYANETKWENYQDFLNKFQQSIKKNDIQTAWDFQNPKEKSPKTLLVSVSRIDVPNTDKDLSLIITIPKDSVSSSISNLRYFGTAWLGLGLFTTILGSIVIIMLKE